MTPSGLDPALHAPVRLQIATVLSHVDSAEFARLREIAEVSDSVLSKHLAALAEEGYVTLKKAARGGRQRTWVSFTRAGRRAFAAHIAALQAMIAAATAAARATAPDDPADRDTADQKA
jgi:DNA-binding MarR family transcriptional regulator